MWWLLIILLPIMILIFEQIQFRKIRKMIQHTPGPRAWPIFGNALELNVPPSDILHWLFKQWYKFGQSNYKAWVGYQLHLVITNVKDIEFILSSTSFLEKSNLYDMLHDWLGEGLLTSKGVKWHKHRKMITPAFHFQILQDFHEVMKTNSTKFMAKLSEAAKSGAIFEFQEMAHLVTLDVICDTAMGVHIDAMDNPDTKFAKALKFFCYNSHIRTVNPLKHNHSTYKFFPDYKKHCKNLKVLEDFTNEVIEKRIELLKQEETAKVNAVAGNEFKKRKLAFLDTLLMSKIDGRPLTKRELYEEVSTFIFEGHDTTTSAVTFTTFMLSLHQEVQKKVFEEQQLIMGYNLKADANFQQLSEMKYLEFVIKETLRLYPSVPIIGRLADKEYDMNGKLIPKNTSMLLFIMAMGYNESIFPDPYRFKPERFAVDADIHNPYEYVPFSAGPRNCVGQKFAMLELKTVISKIVRYFQILPALDELQSRDGYVRNFFGPWKEQKPRHAKYDPILSAVLTLKSDNGIYLRMKDRE